MIEHCQSALNGTLTTRKSLWKSIKTTKTAKDLRFGFMMKINYFMGEKS